MRATRSWRTCSTSSNAASWKSSTDPRRRCRPSWTRCAHASTRPRCCSRSASLPMNSTSAKSRPCNPGKPHESRAHHEPNTHHQRRQDDTAMFGIALACLLSRGRSGGGTAARSAAAGAGTQTRARSARARTRARSRRRTRARMRTVAAAAAAAAHAAGAVRPRLQFRFQSRLPFRFQSDFDLEPRSGCDSRIGAPGGGIGARRHRFGPAPFRLRFLGRSGDPGRRRSWPGRPRRRRVAIPDRGPGGGDLSPGPAGDRSGPLRARASSSSIASST